MFGILTFGNMKKSITKFLILCCIIAVLVTWNGIYTVYILRDREIWDIWLGSLIDFVLPGIKEEVIFRYLPFIFVTCIYVGLKKIGDKWAKISIIPIAIFMIAVQFVFSSLHLPLNPVYREILYELPPRPTFEELFDTFLLQGVAGIMLCISYIIYIPKNSPLSLLQIRSLLASSFVHIVYNQLVVILYFPNY